MTSLRCSRMSAMLASSNRVRLSNRLLWGSAENRQDHRRRVALVEINGVGRDPWRCRRGRAERFTRVRIDFEFGGIRRGHGHLNLVSFLEGERRVPQIDMQFLGFARRHQHYVIGVAPMPKARANGI